MAEVHEGTEGFPVRRRDFLVSAITGGGAAILALDAAQATRSDNRSDVPQPATAMAIAPFRARLAPAAVSDLRRRLSMARWPERETVSDWSQGVPLAKLQALIAYWRDHYDMHRLETRLNEVNQFRTHIDGLGIHFIHVRSRHANARPIILTHGWPGSVIEFLNIIGPLTDPTAHGGRAEDAFHVVIPSLPGYGFSDRPTERGWGLPRIARAWGALMTRLGYQRYVAQGGDWGAGVTTWMAKQNVPGLVGIHLNLPLLVPPPIEGAPNAEEQASIVQLVAFDKDASGYAKIQGTRPQTIAYALADSPVGQAAWIYEKFADWTDTRHEPESEVSRDQMLDNIMLYWMTDTAASSARLYFESFTTDFSAQKLDLPVAVSVFPGELYRPLKIWGKRIYSNLVYWNEVSKGGHFAAFEQPGIFVEELRRSVPKLIGAA
ncbi:epoxide hydrolase family protein [Sphingomonas glacialis]|uniref:Epoxide hydrolase n=1 Tax=Sphingomonas glacialis TaxID=658225 RepID=A0A502FTA8_9SPHN|nr:epoxide hydrolase [Sphingomonas glacialis]TPG52640.1 epoxide hydrolase [Sphingomonas glacialis]